MSAEDDLKLLFGNYAAWREARPQRSGLVTDLGVPLVVEHARGLILDYSSLAEARIAAKCYRPKVLPRLTEARQVAYWVQYNRDLADWQIIEYTMAGEFVRGHFRNASGAYYKLLEFRARERARVPKAQVPPKPKRLPEPPWRCWCGMNFESAEAILAHRHGGATPQKESHEEP